MMRWLPQDIQALLVNSCENATPMQLWFILLDHHPEPELLHRAYVAPFVVPATKAKLLGMLDDIEVCHLECLDVMLRDGHHDDAQLERVANHLISVRVPPVKMLKRVKEILNEV